MALGVILSLVIGDQLMGEGKQGFQYIQEYTGFVSPGIFAMFILGFFWKKATSNAALFATIGGFVFSVFFKLLPRFANLEFLSPFGYSKLVLQDDKVTKLYEIPFFNRMEFVFIICVVGMYIISMIENAKGLRTNGLEIDASMFKTNKSFTIGAIIICVILTALYTIFW